MKLLLVKKILIKFLLWIQNRRSGILFVTTINKELDIIKSVRKLKHIPRIGDMVLIGDGDTYKVIGTGHLITKGHKISIYVEKLSQ